MDLDALLDDELHERDDLTPERIAALCLLHPHHAARLIAFYAAWYALDHLPSIMGPPAGAGGAPRRSGDAAARAPTPRRAARAP